MMARKFIRPAGVLCLLLSGLLLSTGCGKQEYERTEITSADAPWQAAQALLANLSSADEKRQTVLLDQAVPADVPAEKRAALQSLLRTISAGEYRIAAMDRWGENILRCTIEYTDADEQPQSAGLLLIEDAGQFYWIGMN